MGFFSRLSNPPSAPTLTLDAGEKTRLRIMPTPVGTKYEIAEKIWQHSPPYLQREMYGGFCSIRCIGKRDGCIFHDNPYKWTNSTKAPVNVIEYELDKTERFTGNRTVKLWLIGKETWETLESTLDFEKITDPTTVDIFLKRIGEGTNTSYQMKIERQVLEPVIDWNLPEINASYRDDTYPYLIDYEKLWGFEPQTRASQDAWLQDRLERGRSAENTSPEAAPDASSHFTPPSLASAFPSPSAAIPSFGAALAAQSTSEFHIGDPNLARKSAVVDYASIEALPVPYPNDPRKMGDLDAYNLEYILNTPGFSKEYVGYAKALLTKPTAAAAPPPPPPQAPVAATPPPPAPAPAPAAPALQNVHMPATLTNAHAPGSPVPYAPPFNPAPAFTPPPISAPPVAAAAPQSPMDQLVHLLQTNPEFNTPNNANLPLLLAKYKLRTLAEAAPSQIAHMIELLTTNTPSAILQWLTP